MDPYSKHQDKHIELIAARDLFRATYISKVAEPSLTSRKFGRKGRSKKIINKITLFIYGVIATDWNDKTSNK